MRGRYHFNFPAFDAAAERFKMLGWQVFNPADFDRDTGFEPADLPDDYDWKTAPDSFDLKEAMARDIEAIMQATAIAMLPGWEHSTGAQAEYHLAKWRNIEILDAETGLPLEHQHGGVKHDQDKPRVDLISRCAVEGLGRVLGFGAGKYTADNWRGGFEWRRLIGAAQRHLLAFQDGDDIDPESGLPHIDHLGCCWMFLSEHYHRGLGVDDRYKSLQAGQRRV